MLILKNVFFDKNIFDERGCCKCEKYYTMLVHNLKTSKTGVFDVIKGVNSPPQARKKSGFPFFLHTVKGYTPPPGGGVGLAVKWYISLGFRKFLVYKPYDAYYLEYVGE